MSRSRDVMGVIHEFASGAWSDGHNSSHNVFFVGDTLYSYGYHFKMAQRVQTKRGAEAFLITTDTYSVTTAKHLTYAARALCGVANFFVPRVDIEAETPKYNRALPCDIRAIDKKTRANIRKVNAVKHADNIADYRERFTEALEAVTRSRKYKDMLLESALRLAAEANQYIEAFKLRAAPIETDSLNLDAIAARVKKAAKARKAAEAKAAKALARENAEKIHAWRRGERVYLPYGIETLLRISADGKMVITSHNANFPVSAAHYAWSAIKFARTSKTRWQSNGSQIRLGIHKLDYVQPNGDLKAGCHYVKYTESLAIARALNLEV